MKDAEPFAEIHFAAQEIEVRRDRKDKRVTTLVLKADEKAVQADVAARHGRGDAPPDEGTAKGRLLAILRHRKREGRPGLGTMELAAMTGRNKSNVNRDLKCLAQDRVVEKASDDDASVWRAL
jgi:hypothetical protein